jgi:hypothetical protein
MRRLTYPPRWAPQRPDPNFRASESIAAFRPRQQPNKPLAERG